MSYSQSTFARNFADVSATAEFNNDWHNGTGYFNQLTKTSSLNVEPGNMAKIVADDGRRIIVVGTRFGNCVYFERYSPKTVNGEEVRSSVITCNVPEKLRKFAGEGSLNEGEIQNFCSSIWNIGNSIEALFQ